MLDWSKMGLRIKMARKQHSMTQASLAQIIDVTPKYLSVLERGVQPPKFETFIDIANALDVDANTLLVDYLTVSTPIESNMISEKLAGLTPDQQRRILRILDFHIQEEMSQQT